MDRIRTLLHDEEGATAIEYGLIAGLVSVVIIGALTLLGNNLSALFEQIATTLE
jgi:pilus assembly protein Flp/PilA